MSLCCCSLAGTAACKYCSNNPNVDTPPPVRTYTTVATDKVLLINNVKTNADRIRAMSDEEISEWFWWMLDYTKCYTDSRLALIAWLKKEVEE